jgi:hypothetical protein
MEERREDFRTAGIRSESMALHDFLSLSNDQISLVQFISRISLFHQAFPKEFASYIRELERIIRLAQ